MLRIGVIGYGYWGPNIVRNLYALDDVRFVSICDQDPIALKRAMRLYSNAWTTLNSDDILRSPDIDAIAVTTPTWTHFDLARVALENGKHVFIEKPMTLYSYEAEKLIELAQKKNLKIMIDHTFLFTEAVKMIHQLIYQGVLGDVYYYDSMRVNLGIFRNDTDVIYDLASHDLSIMDYIINKKPQGIIATGKAHFNKHIDMAFITVYFGKNTIAHINVNWLSPVKVRTTLIGGSRKMIMWNDLDADEKVKVYDKGVQLADTQNIHEALASYRSGDIWIPKLSQEEALKVELAYFLKCIETNETPINDGVSGLRIVKLLEAAEESIRMGREIIL
jgi:predicted dehydrogenase